MVKPICKDIFFFGRMCKTADKSDCSIADDLVDTLKANSETCVGMAANMIGSDKRIIAVNDRGRIIVMFNGEIAGYFPDANNISESDLGMYMLGAKHQSAEEIGGALND